MPNGTSRKTNLCRPQVCVNWIKKIPLGGPNIPCSRNEPAGTCSINPSYQNHYPYPYRSSPTLQMDLEPSLSIQIKICCLDIAPGYCSWDTFRRIIWPSSCQISFLYAFAAAQTMKQVNIFWQLTLWPKKFVEFPHHMDRPPNYNTFNQWIWTTNNKNRCVRTWDSGGW